MKRYLPKAKVIEFLKQGWEIYSGSTEHHGKKGQLVYAARWYKIADNTTSFWIHHSTIKALTENKTIGEKYKHNTES